MPEATSEDQADERPCLHCMMVELIDDFFAEYPAAGGEPDTVDTEEVLTAVAKTVAELTSTQNSTIRQQMIEQLMRDIMEYDAEFRQEDATGSAARHSSQKSIRPRRGALDDRAAINARRQQTERAARLFAETR